MYQHSKFKQNRWSHFWKNLNFKFFLMWTTLNFGGSSKMERTGRRYLQGYSRYRIWTRLVSWFRCYFSWRTAKFKTIYLVSGIFSGKAKSVILLGFECTINPQILIKIVRAIFEKIDFCFLCELPLILGLGGKLKKRLEIFTWGPYYIEFERDRSIGLGSTFGDGHTERQTHTHRHFSKTHF